MNQIPNIEETELIKFITDIVWEATDGGVKITPSQFSHFEEPIGALTDFQKYLHQQLQKAREEAEKAVWERIKKTAQKDETGMYMFYLADHSELDQDNK